MSCLHNVLMLICASLFLYCSGQQKAADALDAAAAKAGDSTAIESEKLYREYCAGCHGQQMMAFADRRWKYGKDEPSIFRSIKMGHSEAGMPGWAAKLSDEQITKLTNYILKGIEHTARYGFERETLESDTFHSEMFSFSLDTVAAGFNNPWGMAFLPSGDMLVTEQSGKLYRVDKGGTKIAVSGVPAVHFQGQGGLLDIELHPDFENNRWLYISYSDPKVEDGNTVSGTALSRYRLESDRLRLGEKLFEGLPYSAKRHHYGSRIEFDSAGYLYLSVGDRGSRDKHPQSLESHCGKIHRLRDDGSIPADNPFAGRAGAVESIYSYGHRNPQGMALNPSTNTIWIHEHGPRGGDEVNIISKGLNYGWPVISYGINYDGTTFTDELEREGMEQPVLYWVPSIAPSGMTFVDSDKYPGWKGDLLVGSLRFKYLNRCKVRGDKIVAEENLMKNIGRVRNVRMAPDGYIYVAVEEPGYIFRLMPI